MRLWLLCALYTCQRLGLDAVGYVADRQAHVYTLGSWAGELPALWLAWWQLWVSHPLPVLGAPIPIVGPPLDKILLLARIAAVKTLRQV